MENVSPPEQSGWLQELAAKSWSLEMTISGAATVAVSFLPGLIDRGLMYYLDHLAPGMNKIAILFPVLAYSFFQAVGWVLICFFVLHLCMRALWVGAVGLHASFPDGIRYERLPNVSDQYRRLAAERFGTLEQFILRLNQRCNRLFALAFILAMGMTGIGILYLVIFGALLLMRAILPPDIVNIAGIVLYLLFMAILFATMVLQWWIKKRPEKERLGIFMARIQMMFSTLMLPMVGRPSHYLSMTFMSNVSRFQYYGSLVLFILLMIGTTIGITFQRASHIRGGLAGFNRSYFSEGGRRSTAAAAAYDDTRGPEDGLTELSLPSAIVSEGWLPVFVKYPHYFDNRLSGICIDDGSSVPDSLPGRIRRERIDSLRLTCFSTFLHLQLNDTLDLAAEWLFSEKNGTPGLIAYVPTAAFPPGKNWLTVKIPSEEKKDSLELYGATPFWLSR